jgi:DNA repair photolyase
MKPIYEPKGRAKEYGNHALNIYIGCSHRCYYCYSPNVLKKDREEFHAHVEPRNDIVEATKRQIETEGITGKRIHLCFSCDPYPRGYDSTVTRTIIETLKNAGNRVQILTKNGQDAERDFDLLGENDWFGISYAGYEIGTLFNPPKEEPGAGSTAHRLVALDRAHKMGIKTWVSCEPIINGSDVISLIQCADYVDLWKIGKMNYHPSNVDWAAFGRRVEAVCKEKGRNYYIKEDLRKEMAK